MREGEMAGVGVLIGDGGERQQGVTAAAAVLLGRPDQTTAQKGIGFAGNRTCVFDGGLSGVSPESSMW
jgi:hypothetical protein